MSTAGRAVDVVHKTLASLLGATTLLAAVFVGSSFFSMYSQNRQVGAGRARLPPVRSGRTCVQPCCGALQASQGTA